MENDKKRLAMITLGILLLFCAGMLFNGFGGISGFAINDVDTRPYSLQKNISDLGEVSKNDAIAAITESYEIMAEMQQNNFSIVYMNDSLLEAKRNFDAVGYVGILRNDSSSPVEKKQASDALKLIDWNNISYADVLIYTNRIRDRRAEAYLIFDSLSAFEKRLDAYRGSLNTSEVDDFFNKSKIAFYEDRYDESIAILDRSKQSLEIRISDSGRLSVIREAAKNFFQKNWIEILIVLSVLSIIGYIVYLKLRKKIIISKIKRMRAEMIAIDRLIRKTQTERYKENILPESIYQIRIKHYNDRLDQIKEILPVLEERLKKER